MLIKNVFQNTMWIYVLQVTNAVVPLVTLPYATRTVGLDGVAFFGTAVALGTIASVLSEYSFDLSGIKDAAHADGFNGAKNRVIFGRMYAQWTIFAATISVALLIASLAAFTWKGPYLLLIGSAALVTLTNITFPFWVSQSLGMVLRYAIYFSTARLISLPLVYLLLANCPTGACYVVMLYLPLFLSMVLLLTRSLGRVLFVVPYRFRDLVDILGASFRVFLSRLFVALYQNGGMLALGLISSPEAAGLYALSDRVRKASLFLLTPISRALYPIACSLTKMPDDGSSSTFRLFVFFYLGAALFATVALFIFAPQIAVFFTDEEGDSLATLIRISAFFPLVSTGTVIFGQNFLLARGHVLAYTRAVTGAFLFYALVLFPLVCFASAIGATAAYLCAEILLASAFLLLVRLKRT